MEVSAVGREQMIAEKQKREELTALFSDRIAVLKFLVEAEECLKKQQGIETYKKAEIWERSAPNAPYTLVYKKVGYAWHSVTYGDPALREFYLRDNASDAEELLSDVTHANFNHKGRLVMARYGAILASDLQEPLQAHVLVDLNSQQPPQRSSHKD